MYCQTGGDDANIRQTEERAAVIQKNFLLAYILLVGLPLLGVFTVLKGGRGLVPLPAMSGDWDLSVDASTAAANNCFAPLTVPRQTVAISQSGADVIVSFKQLREISIAGTLEGNHLTGITGPSGPAGTCAEGAALRWTATVMGAPGQRTLDGHFFIDACASCAPAAFHAVRRSPLRKPGR
jgi:hypothetical protein